MFKKIYSIKTKGGVFNARIWRDKSDKVYLVKGVNFPEVVTFGKTVSEAKKMAKDAFELYCECITEESKLVIDDERKVIGKIPKSHILPLSG
ncbi:MAG: type II toxin-antitoxin system HicB family antitoxin [Parcubacteria group bacterium]|nr:type II toxin-antitoxin system HicB family antitoxin [Parcubacteria group bacterium]